MVFLVFILLIVGTIGVGWYMLQNGTLTQKGIFNTLGMGTGEADVINLSDGDLSVNIASLDDKSGSSLLKTDLALKPFDSDSFTSIKPGRYRLTFAATAGQASGTCTLQVGSGDVYQFAAVNEGVVITSDKHPASTGEELDMSTSSLCKK
jgi:hypothetical protein